MPGVSTTTNKSESVKEKSIFISYSRKDIRFARRLTNDLKAADHSVWMDVSTLRGGQDWPERIDQAVRECDTLILVVSPDSMKSDWVSKETMYAMNLKKYIVPVMCRQAELSVHLADIHHIDFRDRYDEALQQLQKALLEGLSDLHPLPKPFYLSFARNPHFVGRDAELDDLHESLQKDQRLVLVGMSGIGKTQLAIEYAYSHQNAYPDGIYWIDVPQFLNELSIEEVFLQTWSYMEYRPNSLIIFDFDNVDEPIKNLGEPIKNPNFPLDSGLHLDNFPCRTLFIAQQQDVQPPFQPIEVRELSETASLDLLLHTQPDIRKNERSPEWNDARAICASLGYIPLALELAAKYLGKYHKEISLAGYLEQLEMEGNLRVLGRTKIDPLETPTRHATAVAAVLKLQWNKLPDDDCRVALKISAMLYSGRSVIERDRLATFSGISDGYPPPSPLRDVLDRLQEYSFITDLTENDFRLNSLISEFAKKQELGNKPEERLVNHLRRLMNNGTDDSRQAAHLLTNIKWFDQVPSTELPPEELLNYLELLCRSLNSNQERNYILEHGILPVIKSQAKTKAENWSLREWANLCFFSAGFRAELQNSRDAILDFEKARLWLDKLENSREWKHEDNKLAARINLSEGNEFSKQGEYHLEEMQEKEAQEELSLAIDRYGAAERYKKELEKELYKDKVLAVIIKKEWSYTCALLKQWDEAKRQLQEALIDLQEDLCSYAMILDKTSKLHQLRAQNQQEIRNLSSKNHFLVGTFTRLKMILLKIRVMGSFIVNRGSVSKGVSWKYRNPIRNEYGLALELVQEKSALLHRVCNESDERIGTSGSFAMNIDISRVTTRHRYRHFFVGF